MAWPCILRPALSWWNTPPPEVGEEDDDNDGGSDGKGTGGVADAPQRYGVGDKGYHKTSELVELVAAGIEPVRQRCADISTSENVSL